MPDSYWETLLDCRDERWEFYSDAEYMEWCDAQTPSRPEPEDIAYEDIAYEDDF